MQKTVHVCRRQTLEVITGLMITLVHELISKRLQVLQRVKGLLPHRLLQGVPDRHGRAGRFVIGSVLKPHGVVELGPGVQVLV